MAITCWHYTSIFTYRLLKFYELQIFLVNMILCFLSPAHVVGWGILSAACLSSSVLFLGDISFWGYDLWLIFSPLLILINVWDRFCFQVISRKAFAGLFSYCINTSLRRCRCAFDILAIIDRLQLMLWDRFRFRTLSHKRVLLDCFHIAHPH